MNLAMPTPPEELPRVLPRPLLYTCPYCKGQMTAGVHADTIQCRKCGSVWPRERKAR